MEPITTITNTTYRDGLEIRIIAQVYYGRISWIYSEQMQFYDQYQETAEQEWDDFIRNGPLFVRVLDDAKLREITSVITTHSTCICSDGTIANILGKDKISADNPDLDTGEHVPVKEPPAYRPAEVTGEWRDENGRHLIIHSGGRTALLVDIRLSDGSSPERILLDGKKSPALGMPGQITGNRIIVELGTPGLGPTLELIWNSTKQSDGELIPHLAAGMYDDFDDDLGVSWILPLTTYRRNKT